LKPPLVFRIANTVELPAELLSWSRFLGDDGNRVNQLTMALGRDRPSQEIQKIGGEERVTGKIVETEKRPFHDVNLLEAHVEKLFQQHWFHQCAGQSAGQGGRAFENRFR
jgi:hypothetical protein